MKVAVVDYGAGNIRSVCNAFERIGAEPSRVTTPEEVLAADRIVLPGVGAAGEALERLRRDGLDEALNESVRVRGRPFIGICLGLQLIAERLTEFGTHRGLGWLEGEIGFVRDDDAAPIRVPHMGWNAVGPTDIGQPMFKGIPGRREFYFAHSFLLRTTKPSVVAAKTEYGGEFVSAVMFENVFATQFHPEKSQINGERLLENFLSWNP